MIWLLLAWALLASATVLWLTWRWHHTRMALLVVVEALREAEEAQRLQGAAKALKAPRKPGRRSWTQRAKDEAQGLIRDAETGWL